MRDLGSLVDTLHLCFCLCVRDICWYCSSLIVWPVARPQEASEPPNAIIQIRGLANGYTPDVLYTHHLQKTGSGQRIVGNQTKNIWRGYHTSSPWSTEPPGTPIHPPLRSSGLIQWNARFHLRLKGWLSLLGRPCPEPLRRRLPHLQMEPNKGAAVMRIFCKEERPSPHLLPQLIQISGFREASPGRLRLPHVARAPSANGNAHFWKISIYGDVLSRREGARLPLGIKGAGLALERSHSAGGSGSSSSSTPFIFSLETSCRFNR